GQLPLFLFGRIVSCTGRSQIVSFAERKNMQDMYGLVDSLQTERRRCVAPILNRIAGVSNNKTIMGTKAADRLVETICRAGIRRIYAVAGDSLNEVNDAVRRAGTVEWVHMRHEESGAFAASAEAQLNGIACCAGSSGPGHVHLVNGLYDAQRSNASVLAIASTCA